jgi:hypothetical protein
MKDLVFVLVGTIIIILMPIFVPSLSLGKHTKASLASMIIVVAILFIGPAIERIVSRW